MSKNNTDIIIIGGGINGLTLSLLLAQNNFTVLCIDAQNPFTKNDNRTTAISYGSSQIMGRAGLWDSLIKNACPIKEIKILDGKSPILLDFNAQEIAKDTAQNTQESAFGWIVENKFLRDTLNTACQNEKNITHLTDTLVDTIHYTDIQATVALKTGQQYNAPLIIGADGRQSFTRKAAGIKCKSWSYHQQAIICAVTHDNPHHNIAIENFRKDGPFAILPMNDTNDNKPQSAVVWTIEEKDSKTIMHHPDVLTAALNERFPDTYGNVTIASPAQIYPLNFNHAYQYVAPRTALIGDAAHGIHPIAGQGLNIGLQDVNALTDILTSLKNKKKDIGALENLKQYETNRRPDNTAMAAATDILNRLFSNRHTTTRIARTKGLKIIERFKPSKKFFMKQAMGLKD